MSDVVRAGAAVIVAAVVGIVAAGCGGPHAEGAQPSGHVHHGHAERSADFGKVYTIHGGAGPWVVAGWRMGQHAMKVLGTSPYDFDLEVTHVSPKQVQYSCIADGAAAATGASLGKLNLRLDEAPRDRLATTYRKKSTGQAITLRPTTAFEARFKDVPREKLGDAGAEVRGLSDSEIFEVVPERP
ncbi:MAG: FmdE family protein [Polyangiaceae bacterium]